MERGGNYDQQIEKKYKAISRSADELLNRPCYYRPKGIEFST